MVLTLAEAFDMRLQGGDHKKRSSKQQLLDHLRDKRLLLLLDNLEHLLSSPHPPGPEAEVGATSLLAEILQSTPRGTHHGHVKGTSESAHGAELPS